MWIIALIAQRVAPISSTGKTLVGNSETRSISSSRLCSLDLFINMWPSALRAAHVDNKIHRISQRIDTRRPNEFVLYSDMNNFLAPQICAVLRS